MARKINAIANNRAPSQLSLDGLLINGLEVRVLPGSPLNPKHLQENRGKREKVTVAETVAGSLRDCSPLP
jgi:hypothetical protein